MIDGRQLGFLLCMETQESNSSTKTLKMTSLLGQILNSDKIGINAKETQESNSSTKTLKIDLSPWTNSEF